MLADCREDIVSAGCVLVVHQQPRSRATIGWGERLVNGAVTDRVGMKIVIPNVKGVLGRTRNRHPHFKGIGSVAHGGEAGNGRMSFKLRSDSPAKLRLVCFKKRVSRMRLKLRRQAATRSARSPEPTLRNRCEGR